MLIFGVNESYVSRELHHIVPIIHWVYRLEIRWPSKQTRALLEGTLADVDDKAIGSMDFTITPRQHSLARDENFYRGDKGVPFLNNFAVADFRGLWFDFEAGFQGHAADQRSFILSNVGKGDCPLSKKQKLLADGGFSTTDQRVLTPNKTDERSRIHKANRCGIENTFRDYKIFRSVGEVSRHSPAFQALYVSTIARVSNHLWRKRLANGLAVFDVLNSEIGVIKQ